MTREEYYTDNMDHLDDLWSRHLEDIWQNDSAEHYLHVLSSQDCFWEFVEEVMNGKI